MAGSSELLVFVTVGTDHHPFPRVLDWVARWNATRPDARVIAQCGTATPPHGIEGRDYLDHDELLALMGRADAVVTHGGPTSIVEARRHGHLPIVVPRRHRGGEAVDDHQARFSARLAQLQQIVVPADADELARSLDAALSAPRAQRADDEPDVARTVAQFAELVDGLLVRGLRRPRRRGVRSLVDRTSAGRT